MQCKGCGAALEGSPTASSWICGYCKIVNVNEHFLSVYARNTDFTKSDNLLKLAMVAYEAGDFRRAFEKFEAVTLEDPDNVDAWSYGAVCSARTATSQTFDEQAKISFAWLQRAEVIDSSAEVFVVANGVCRDEFGAIALRAIERHFREGNDAFYAFKSTDKALALKKQVTCFNRAFQIATKTFESPPNDSTLLGRIAFDVLSNIALLPRGAEIPICAEQARGALTRVASMNPQLAAEIESSLSRGNRIDGSTAARQLLLVGAVLHVLLLSLPADVCLVIGLIMYGKQARPLAAVSNAIKRLIIVDAIAEVLNMAILYFAQGPSYDHPGIQTPILTLGVVETIIEMAFSIFALVAIVRAWRQENFLQTASADGR